MIPFQGACICAPPGTRSSEKLCSTSSSRSVACWFGCFAGCWQRGSATPIHSPGHQGVAAVSAAAGPGCAQTLAPGGESTLSRRGDNAPEATGISPARTPGDDPNAWRAALNAAPFLGCTQPEWQHDLTCSSMPARPCGGLCRPNEQRGPALKAGRQVPLAATRHAPHDYEGRKDRMTVRSINQPTAQPPAGDVTLSVRFDPCSPPQCVDVEVVGDNDLTTAGLLEIVEAATLRLITFAADYRMAALLDCVAGAHTTGHDPSGPAPAEGRSISCSPTPLQAPLNQAAHLRRGAKQDKGC